MRKQRKWLTALITVSLMGFLPVLPALAVTDPADTIFISEIHYDNVSDDAGEAFEVFGPGGTDLSDWSVILYNGSSTQLKPYETVDISSTIPGGGFGTGYGVVSFAASGMQNGAPDGLALVDPAQNVVQFLSYEGSFTAVEGPASGMTSTDIGVSESGSTAIGASLALEGSGNCYGGYVWTVQAVASFGDLGPMAPSDTCEEPPPPPPPPVPELTLIHDIQGSGFASSMIGERVVIEGVVVGDEEGPAPALRGFFVQEEDADADGDPATSEGIFVYNWNNDFVNVGDVVRVEGTVEERFGNTQLTEFVGVEVLDVDPRIATPADVLFPVSSSGDLEAYEGMSVKLVQDLVISEYFNYDRFGEVVVALPVDGEDRPMNPTALFDPESQEAADRLDLNLRSRITIDDGNSFQNPSDPVHPINRELFSLQNTFRGGDVVTGLTGPIYYGFSQYRILPVTDNGYDSYVKADRDLTPADVGGDLKVATLNALNYFLTLDGNGRQCGPDKGEFCRGADDAGELERQRVKLLNALEGLDADVVGLVELENTVDVEALADLVNGLNDRLGAGTYDYVAAGTDSVVGDDVIKNGVIYKPGSVTQVGDIAILDTADFLDPNNLDDSKNRAAIGVTFIENATGEVFSVAVNHLKSKGSGCGAGDDHPLAGSCNLTRTLAAQKLAAWIATSPTGIPDDDWMIIGDLNSYDQEAPIAALADAGYTDLVGQFQGALAYSFVFDGQFGYLDYAMSSDSLTSQVTGATIWHINADEPDILDYDTSFKSTYQDGLFEPDNAFRSSDHDAALVGLSLASLDPTVTPEPDKLWSPNHKLNSVTVTAGDPIVGALDVLITDVMSSEADSGLGDGDVPNDINVVSDNVVELRSERFSRDGRTYTIYVMVSGGGQAVFTSAEVFVVHDQRKKPKKK